MVGLVHLPLSVLVIQDGLAQIAEQVRIYNHMSTFIILHGIKLG